jgi:hypothetical protein
LQVDFDFNFNYPFTFLKGEYSMNFIAFTKLGRTLLLSAVAVVVSVSWLGCGGDDNPTKDQPAVVNSMLNGAWLRSSEYDSDWYLQLKIDGNNWVWSQGPSGNLRGSSKGTWSTNSTMRLIQILCKPPSGIILNNRPKEVYHAALQVKSGRTCCREGPS